ncbi:I78 family peptidase inhibitor [Comamonas aquatica]|jgi:hypothetical protein|uniref:I78 family peptidase inhibitor n=1 Tax=Comamonas aquatica TaxID=225991 RepID=UPI0021B14D87|nr:I78 family peptidase inhibitor [Comamonas aquatica]
MHLGLHALAMTAVAALAAGCTLTPPRTGGTGAQQPPRPVQTCNPDKAQWAVGKTNTEHTVTEARKRAGAYMVRVLRPGQATTMEFNGERLNLEVDATGRIVAARCG